MGGSSGTPEYGSVGRPGGGGGGGSSRRKFDCKSFTATVTLTSPVKRVIDKLKEGDQLKITLTKGAAPIVAVSAKGETAGSIVVPEQADVIECIKKGTSYIAEVLSIERGACVVDIAAE